MSILNVLNVLLGSKLFILFKIIFSTSKRGKRVPLSGYIYKDRKYQFFLIKTQLPKS